jgi:hypothetical protein
MTAVLAPAAGLPGGSRPCPCSRVGAERVLSSYKAPQHTKPPSCRATGRPTVTVPGARRVVRVDDQYPILGVPHVVGQASSVLANPADHAAMVQIEAWRNAPPRRGLCLGGERRDGGADVAERSPTERLAAPELQVRLVNARASHPCAMAERSPPPVGIHPTVGVRSRTAHRCVRRSPSSHSRVRVATLGAAPRQPPERASRCRSANMVAPVGDR